MKSKVVLMCMVALVSVQAGAAVLFSDSYDRANDTNISASSVGQGGTLSPMPYVESWEGSGTATSIQISSNKLEVANGVGMSNLYLNHNFTDAEISTAGGFSVSLDVLSIVTSDDLANRFGGFGLGMTLDEAANAKDINDSPTTMRARGILAGATTVGICDFFVDTALDNKLRVWSNGVNLATVDVASYVGTIKVDFTVPDFNIGTLVSAAVYFNGNLMTTQTFDWDNAEANYVGLSGRAPGAGAFLDNLSITTIPEPATLVLLALGGVICRFKKK
jgi:hypothetical protein